MSRKFINILNVLNHQKPTVINNARCYGRWMHRNPAKVLLPLEPTDKPQLKKEKIIELPSDVLDKRKKSETDAQQNNSKTTKNKSSSAEPSTENADIPAKKATKTKKQELIAKRKFYLSQKKVFDDNGEIIYEKLNENDGRVSSLLVKLKTKKDRMKVSQTLVEGWRLIVDGLEAKCNLQYVIFSRLEDLNNLRRFLPKTGILFYKMPYKEMALFSDVETTSGIFGIFETPKIENVKRSANPLPLQLICDNVRMPGNLGAILRAAVGAGCDRVLLTKGCVDVWDPKVIRSGAGAHFRLPLHHSLEWPDIHKMLQPDTSIFIADSNTQIEEEGTDNNMQIPVLPYYGIEFATLNHITLVVGGETEGISDESYELAIKRNGLRLNIPLSKGVDSLNTGMATAVIAFEIRKQLIQAWRKIRNDKMAEGI